MSGFRFGIEAEFLLAKKSDWTPLWHNDLSFAKLNEIFEAIPLDGIPDLSGLDLEPPHRKMMPFVVEGYLMPNPAGEPTDVRAKGVEIRTPVCSSIDECLEVFEILLRRLQVALAAHDLAPVALSHHPIATKFEGPQNKRRHDFWQWAMEVMTTFGPDINVGIPPELSANIDLKDLEAKINYYGPALAALSVASPFVGGAPWEIRGKAGKSFRMYKRSVIAPPIEIHPHENWRLEFKVFDMPVSTAEFRSQILCFLALLLCPELKGRASNQSRVYDLGQVARVGLEAECVRERLEELFEKSPKDLQRWGFDPSGLEILRERVLNGRTPADDILDLFRESGGSLAAVLAHRAAFRFEANSI